MWLLITVATLQVLFLIERLFNVILFVLIPGGDQDGVKSLARRGVMSTLFSNFVLIATLPIQLVLLIIESLFANVYASISLFFIFIILSIAAQNPSSFFAYFINTYNSGLGVMLNFIFVKPLEILSWCVVYLIPIFNSITYWLKEVAVLIFFDVLQLNLSILLKIVENTMLIFGSSGLSIGTWAAHVSDCVIYQVVQYRPGESLNSSIPYTRSNMDCVANDNYLNLDVMTPALYAQKIAGNLNELIGASCSSMLLPINIAMYPLLDYNLWLVLSSAINAYIIHPIVALPIKTWRRCEYGKNNPQMFSEMEQVVMCVPDFTIWYSQLTLSFRSLGRLLDNWLNASLMFIETALGITSEKCMAIPSIRRVWNDATLVLGDTMPLRTVGLTDYLYAVTNGESTVYQSMLYAKEVQVSIGNWPIRIEPRYGVAAIQHSEKFDADDVGNARTGMLGCNCADTVDGIQIHCAAVPYQIHTAEDEDEYNAETVINIVFNPQDASQYMKCHSTQIKVSSLRFSRKRFSFGGTNGVDAVQNDMFDFLGSSFLTTEPETFTADAAITLIPKCSVDSDPACVRVLSSCFPFCMGLHVAGSTSTTITLENAHYWQDFVNILQTDCGIITDREETFCSNPSRVTSQNWLAMLENLCDLPQACISSDYVRSYESLSNLDEQNSFKKTQPTIRLQGQPFVASGDVMLFVEQPLDRSERAFLKVVRLYDNSHGDFTLQNEELVMTEFEAARVRRNVEGDCMISDEYCHEQAMLANEIVLPAADTLERQISHPVATSEWGIHWAVNPDNSVLANLFSFCKDQETFGVTLLDSYGPARVWTLKAMRASVTGTNSGAESQRISYMTVPDWLSSSSSNCRQEVNLKVTDLEYINENNILVTVLRAAPMDYDFQTGQVCETCHYTYSRYFLHPNLAKCINEGVQSNTFSCWRTEESGLFQAEPLKASELNIQIGRLCPAMRRMPELGSMGAELAVAGLQVLKIVLDLITVIPPALIHGNEGLVELFENRLDKVTYHYTLDNSGKRLIDVEQLIKSIDKSMFYGANTIAKMGDLFSNFEGYDNIKPSIIGTTKVVQHMSDTVLLTGPFLSQLRNVEKIPSTRILSGLSSVANGASASPQVISRIQGIVTGFISSFKFNIRLLRRLTHRILRFAPQTGGVAAVASIGTMLTAVAYESSNDLERSTLDNLRVQCDGLGNILNTDNPWAHTVRNGCLIVPDSIEAIFNVLMIFIVEYPIMSCACKVQGEGSYENVLNANCMNTIMPTPYRYTMNKIRASTNTNIERQQTCFAMMDSTNGRLANAFDKVYNRMYKMTKNLGNSMNYLFSFIGLSDEGCENYDISPYVMSIVPDPVDYFQGCALTFDCRTRCSTSMSAFNTVFESVQGAFSDGTLPAYSVTQKLTLHSPFYNNDDIEAQRHVAPFAMHAIQQLPPDVCSLVCGSMKHPRNRCVVVVGNNPHYTYLLKLQYYCVPADYMSSITQYPARDLTNSTLPAGDVISMHLATSRRILQNKNEAILVLSSEAEAEAKTYKLSLLVDGFVFGICSGLPRRADFPRVDSIDDFTTITEALVWPASQNSDNIYVFIYGTQYTPQSNFAKHCVRKTISGTFDAEQKFLDNIQTKLCSPDELLLFSTHHHLFCRNMPCKLALLLPYTKDYSIEMLKIEQNLEIFSIKKTVLHDKDSSKNFATKFSRLVHTSPAIPLYRTSQGTAVRNNRHFSLTGFEQNTDNSFDIFMCGGVSTELSWLHSVRISLEPKTLSVKEVIDTEREDELKINLQCSVDNCIGCQTNPPNNQYNELQARCFEAQSCALKRCIGTTVNLRKPLCNIGQFSASLLDTYRITLQTTWSAVSNMIIMSVELSEIRRNRYELYWLDESLTANTCQAKDAVVEMVAAITSTFGMVSLHTSSNAGPFSEGRKINELHHSHTVIISAAFTKLFSNILLLPIYALLSARKVVSCGLNDTAIAFQNIASGQTFGDSSNNVLFEIGSRKLLPSGEATVGACLSHSAHTQMLDLARNNDDVKKFIEQETDNIIGQLARVRVSASLGMMYYPIHASFTWLISVFSGIEDVMQAFDFKNCKAPVALTDISKCVCGDMAFKIPDMHRRSIDKSSLWCTGPLMFRTTTGDDTLIWNPFSLHDMLDVSYDAYIQCLTTGWTDPSCNKPDSYAVTFFQTYGVDILQVITRCRANYQAKIWDAGAIVFGLFPYSDWQSGELHLQTMLGENFQSLRRQLYVISKQPGISISNFVSQDTWLCFENAVRYVNLNHNCHLEMFKREMGESSVESFFVYEPVVNANPSFSESDSCLAFSGGFSSYETTSNAAHSQSMWSPNSPNSIPVAEYHFRSTSTENNRLSYAQTQLQKYWEDNIKPSIEELAFYEASSTVSTKIWSHEGDVLHQTIDCVVMGPYASADMRASFNTPTGRSFPVPQYHRGSALSRQFTSVLETSGSESRKNIIETLQEEVSEHTGNVLKQNVEQIMLRIRSYFADASSFLCPCPTGEEGRTTRSVACCLNQDWNSIADIVFASKDLLLQNWDIQDDVIFQLLNLTSHSHSLGNNFWTSNDYTTTNNHIFSEEEKEELLHSYVFDFSNPVREYSLDEVDTEMGFGNTLWHDCTALLSASFFSIPLQNDEVDVDMYYDPTVESSNQYLHGMETVVQRILEHSRTKSPTFWTHVHRYVASDSVWCEDAEVVKHAVPNNDVFEAQSFMEQTIEEDEIQSSRAHQLSYPASLHCHCGWKNLAGMCTTTYCTGSPEVCARCWDVEEPLQESWQNLCNVQGTYESRADWFLMLQALSSPNANFENCIDNKPALHWGLMNQEDLKHWYEGGINNDISLFELSTKGPSGLRLAMLGSGPDSLKNHMKTHPVLTHVDGESSRANFHYNHTVGQPVCHSNVHTFVHDDLRKHFTDVFFPMAHSIHESPLSSYCSRWVVEYSIFDAFEKMEISTEEIAKQEEIVLLWKTRCQIQLEQIGICLLRDVYDLVPAQNEQTHSTPTCAFDSTKIVCDDELFYITPSCVVMCGGVFYDPCLCSGQNDCYESTFDALSCQEGKILDVRAFVTDEEVLLNSLHWPEMISEREGNTKEIETILSQLKNKALDLDSTFDEMHKIVNERMHENEEFEKPNAFCDDMLDYWPGDAQHPVGYHPTTCCLRRDTNMRGFTSWMSQPRGAPETIEASSAYVIDPIRLRNLTQYSSEFGASHMVCDSTVYGKNRLNLNPYFLESRWDGKQTADFHTPLQKQSARVLETMRTFGTNPSQDPFLTPTFEADAFMKHSVGLIKFWPFAGTPEYDDMWPYWDPALTPEQTQSQSNYYGTKANHGCSLPPLSECTGDSDCFTTAGIYMACQNNTEGIGICMQRDTCFMHQHCMDGKMCTGDGKCTDPIINIHNLHEINLDVQLQSKSHHCTISNSDISRFQGVDDFANANGLCNFRSWNEYLNFTDNLHSVGGIFHVPDHIHTTTNSRNPMSLKNRGILYQKPHACDRSYEQLDEFSICKIDGSLGLLAEGPATQKTRALRTQTSDSILFCDMNGRSQAVTGFLGPHVTYDNSDTLEGVTNSLKRCSNFEICPKINFRVDDTMLIYDRFVVKEREIRKYSHYDREACGAGGFLWTDETCAVDRFIVPVLDSIFQEPSQISLTVLSRDEMSSNLAFSRNTQQNLFNNLISHCPMAFNNNFDEYYSTVVFLSGLYLREDSERITQEINTLIPRMFGNLRGFPNLETYLQLSDCAQFILTRFEMVYDARKRALDFPYFKENSPDPPTPGRSLYLLTQNTATQVPFMWFWQCLILAHEGEGGAPTNWNTLLETNSEISCPNFNSEAHRTSTESISIRRRLSLAQYIFNVKDADRSKLQGSEILNDIYKTVTYSIDYLKLSNAPDVYCAAWPKNENECPVKSNPNPLRPHIFNSCWQHAGRDKSLTINASMSESSSLHSNLLALIFNGLTGQELIMKAVISTYNDLVENNIISEQLELETLVDPQAVLFRSIHFPRLKSYLKNIAPVITTLESMDVELPLKTTLGNTYAQEDIDFCKRFFDTDLQETHTMFKLNDHEHSNLGSGALLDLGFLTSELQLQNIFTAEQALWLVATVFDSEIVNTNSFQSGNMHTVRQLSTQISASTLAADFKDASELNTFLKNKKWNCGEETWRPEDVTNPQHQRLRDCVEHLSVDIGHILPEAEILKLTPHADILLNDFILAFSEVTEDKFLNDLTSNQIARQAELSRQICYTVNERVQSINPFWATNFDIQTGCDLSKVNNADLNSWLIDVECESSSCSDDFPSYHHGRNTMPEYCLQNRESVIFRRNTGSLADSDPVLCQRKFSTPSICSLRHGTLFNGIGEQVESLAQRFTPTQNYNGLWKQENIEAIFANDIPSNKNKAWRINKEDIAGHSLDFVVRVRNDIDSLNLIASRIELSCVNLLSKPNSNCNPRQYNQFRAKAWMPELEVRRQFQHKNLMQTWRSNEEKHFTCPLQWITSVSNLLSINQIKAPSSLRNQRRFSHITQNAFYAHPTMQYLNTETHNFDFLTPGLFMTEIDICAAHLESCKGRESLLQAVAWSRSEEWNFVNVRSPEASCQQILDWPHVPMKLYDGSFFDPPQPLPTSCNIVDRVPSFAIRKARRTSVLKSATHQTSLSPGGVCHMGRLRRMPAPVIPPSHTGPTDTGGIAYACTQTDLYSRCLEKYTNSHKTSRIDYHFYPDTLAATTLQRKRNRSCKKCEEHATPMFMNTRTKAETLKEGSPKHLSVGVPIKFHPARQLAAQLRKAVCPNTTKTCTKLENLMSADHFNTSLFSSKFIGLAQNRTKNKDNKTKLADNLLWERPWLFCDNTNRSSNCVGSMSKQEWLQPKSRPEKCAKAVYNARPFESDPIQFCKFDSQTSRLCAAIAQWNSDITRIICQLNGISECPETGFFYVPSSYSISNDEFVSTTVDRFYQYEDASGHERECTTQTSQESNWVSSKCSVFVIQPIKTVITLARSVARHIVEIVYYISMMLVKVLEMIVSIFVMGVEGIASGFQTDAAAGNNMMQQAKAGFMVYAKMVLASLQDMWDVISDVIYKLITSEPNILKTMNEILIALCKAWNVLMDVAYEYACPVLRMYVNYLNPPDDPGAQMITGAWISKLATGGVKNRPVFALPIPDDLWDAHLLQVDSFLLMCGYNTRGCEDRSQCPGYQPMEILPDKTNDPGCKLDLDSIIPRKPCACEAISLYLSESEEETALPTPTRCWSTYATYFGDPSPLTCQPRDTCVDPYNEGVGAEPKLCSQCAIPPTGRKNFGCDPILKQCACSVPEYTETRCFTNAECQGQTSSCRFLDGENDENSLSSASVPCSTCSGISTCFVNYGTSMGVCACSLHDMELKKCGPDERGQAVMPGFSKLCLLQPSPAITVSYTGFYDLMSTSFCSNTNPSQTFCYQITISEGIQANLVVAHQTISRRRLLSSSGVYEDDESGDFSCMDSAETLMLLPNNINRRLPLCAFRSIYDFGNTVINYPDAISEIIQNGTIVKLVVQRHTPIHSLMDAAKQRRRMYAYIQNDAPYYFGFNPYSSTQAHEYHEYLKERDFLSLRSPKNTSTHYKNHENHENHKTRELLGFVDIIDSAAQNFEEMNQLHFSFADQIITMFRTDYTPLSNEQAEEWMKSWPPRVITEADPSCSILPKIIQRFAYAMNNMSLYYSALGTSTLPVRPSTPLSQSWPSLLDSSGVQELKNTGNVDEDVIVSSVIVARDIIMDFVGLKKTFVHDFVFSLGETVQNAFRCDLENVQMCYQWRVTLGNGIFIVLVMYSVAFIIAQSLGLTYVVILLLPLSFFFTLYLCYGYQWTCFPLIPTCLLGDIVNTLNSTLPAKIEPIPRVLLRPGTACSHANIKQLQRAPASCFVQCQDNPYRFDSYEAPLAWIVAELQMVVFVRDTILPILTFVDTTTLEYHLKEKELAIKVEDNLVLYRACTVLTSYRLLPYLVIFGVIITAILTISRFFITYVYAATTLVGAIFVEAFT